MPNSAPEIEALARHFEDVIRVMETRFTTHDFILRLAHDNQSEYVAGLAAFTEGGSPFKDLHHALVKRLKSLEGKLITMRKESYPSRDIFGTPSHSGLWKKL